MTREAYDPLEDELRDPTLESAMQVLIDQAQAPPHFAARIRAQVAQRQRRTASFRFWIPVLVTGLVLSLALNIWWGTLIWQALVTHQSVPGPPSRPGSPAVATPAHHPGQTVETLFLHLAEAHLKARYFTKASEAATAALVLNPDSVHAYRYRAMALAELGQPERALQDWRQAASRGDDESRAALTAYQRQNQRF